MYRRLQQSTSCTTKYGTAVEENQILKINLIFKKTSAVFAMYMRRRIREGRPGKRQSPIRRRVILIRN